ncbi:MAG: tripartite tricarboxylate transporter substrate binding protein [Xanthobacteraceae bacterium]|nr:tripartite tricarboxylate transporter substrate binding protein [Xanthobacteraceae bacterium]
MAPLKLFPALLFILGAAAPAAAQDYPSRPITIVVSTAAGGGNDIMARVIGERMSRILGREIVVENRPGAGGTTATRQIAKSAPDGYTLGLGNTGTLAQGPAFYPNAGYDPVKDFTAIGLIANAPVAMVVNNEVPAKSLQEFIALAKREPGKLGYGSGGAGTPNHLVGVMFTNAASVQMIHVPFRGSGPAVAALVGNHVAVMFSGLPSLIANIKSGTLRPLAVTSLKRIAALPEVPTAIEGGLPGFEAAQRYGLIAPAGLPPAITAKLSAALKEALTSDEVKARIDAEGAEPLPSTPEDYVKDIESEWVKWSKVVKDAGIAAN